MLFSPDDGDTDTTGLTELVSVIVKFFNDCLQPVVFSVVLTPFLPN